MPERQRIQWGRAVAWGAYLACSWTWCIGMFLPLLLVRDLGASGWWAFALPNVLGAAAMGWVIRSSLAAGRLRAGHLAMGRVFSLVTIAFHVFFLAWMGGTLVPAQVMPLAVLVVGVVATGCMLAGAGVRWLALALWLASAGVLALLVASDPGAIARTLAARGELPPTDVLWLAPVCVLGFALCPYLDLTFLRARRLCDGPTGPAAFSLGFVLMFAAMIVLTLAYAPMFAPDLLGDPLATRPLWAILCLAHIIVQAGFTIGVHLVELATPEGARRMSDAPERSAPDLPMPLGRTLVLIAMVFAGLLGAAAQTWPPVGPISAGEVAYRCFMAFYGLLAPAYVWLCVLPTPATTRSTGRLDADPARILRPTRRALLTFVVAIALASPFYALGFLWRETFWLVPGLLIVLLARLTLATRLTS